MCGRYASARSAADLAALFDAEDGTGDERLTASYNVAPTDPVHVVWHGRSGAGPGGEAPPTRAVGVARWGLVPHWATDRKIGARMINARAETVATLPAFRDAFRRRRCLVPADGWYEWRRDPEGPGKQPYFLTSQDGGPLVFAGLWSVWRRGDERLVTCAIVTTDALGDLREIHDRMPLVLPPQRWDAWLDTTDTTGAAGDTGGPMDGLLTPPAEEWLAGIARRPVSAAVGNVANNTPDLIREVALPTTGGKAPTPVDLTLF